VTRSFMMTALRFKVLEGSSVFDFNSTGDYFILLRFASQAHLENWRNAPEVRALCKQADAVSTATDRHQVRTGLETWFALPNRSIAPAVPPRWKMFPLVVILSLLIPSALPMVIRIALLTAAPVAMLTWLVMPLLSVLLHEWLYAARTV
jgi:uncharacterized protein